MADIVGSIITGINGIGTDAGDQHAYVDCNFHDGSKHAIVFGPELAAGVCTAFLQAAAHLEKKIAMRSGPNAPLNSTPIPIEKADFLIGKAPGQPDAVILSLQTKSGAALNFELAPPALSKLIQTLNALGMTASKPLQS